MTESANNAAGPILSIMIGFILLALLGGGLWFGYQRYTRTAEMHKLEAEYVHLDVTRKELHAEAERLKQQISEAKASTQTDPQYLSELAEELRKVEEQEQEMEDLRRGLDKQLDNLSKPLF